MDIDNANSAKSTSIPAAQVQRHVLCLIALRTKLAMKMKVCRIHDGLYSYFLLVDGLKIPFSGSEHADYFHKHYSNLGYQVIRSGDGTSNRVPEEEGT